MNNFKVSGVYCIKNLKENKVYVGSSANLKKRRKEHLADLLKGKHHCIHLQRAFHKYGQKYFIFTVITYVDSSRLLTEENRYFRYYDVGNHLKSYNTLRNAGSTLGFKHSVGARTLMSLQRKGRVFSDMHKYHLSLSERGQKRTEDQKKRMSEGCRKRGFTEKQRKVLEERNKNFVGRNNPNSKCIVAVELGKVFYCINEVAALLNRKRSVLESSLKNGTTTCGFHWMYLTDYEKLDINQILKYLREHESPYKAVYCGELNIIFTSRKEAISFTNCNESSFRAFVRNRIVRCGGFTFYYLVDVFQKLPNDYKIFSSTGYMEKLIEEGKIIIPAKGEGTIL